MFRLIAAGLLCTAVCCTTGTNPAAIDTLPLAVNTVPVTLVVYHPEEPYQYWRLVDSIRISYLDVTAGTPDQIVYRQTIPASCTWSVDTAGRYWLFASAKFSRSTLSVTVTKSWYWSLPDSGRSPGDTVRIYPDLESAQ